jgi:hypothetical protein
VTVFVGIAEQSPRRSTAATFVDDAAAALDRARHEELTS